MLVADVLRGDFAVTLFCRPRRFGKTLAMTMLKAFLELPPDGISRAPLFEGLEIWDADNGHYRAEQGVRPTVFFTLNSIKKATWEEAYAALEEKVAAEFRRHRYLLDGDSLDEVERASFKRIAAMEASRTEVESSLRQLCLYLYRHHGRRTVVLIDEYDAPGHGWPFPGLLPPGGRFSQGLAHRRAQGWRRRPRLCLHDRRAAHRQGVDFSRTSTT